MDWFMALFYTKILCMTHKLVDCSFVPWYSVTRFVQTLLVKWQNFVFTNFGRAILVHCFAEYHFAPFLLFLNTFRASLFLRLGHLSMVFWKLFRPNTIVNVTDLFHINYIIYIRDFRYKDFDLLTMVFGVAFWPNNIIKRYSSFFFSNIFSLLISGYFGLNVLPKYPVFKPKRPESKVRGGADLGTFGI